ncbi:MAG: 2Fe-2S iron-sulfur cluster binding domain-containing protein [Candidatus Dasytiphilus stammeri]
MFANNIIINYKSNIFYGNKKQILLEQLEEQGFIIPYLCRIGVCGSCKLKIISNTQKKFEKTIITKIILSCCFIPTNDIILI